MKWIVTVTRDMSGLLKELLSTAWDDHDLPDPPSTIELVSAGH
jgi:hypothetical protein